MLRIREGENGGLVSGMVGCHLRPHSSVKAEQGSRPGEKCSLSEQHLATDSRRAAKY